jgi:virginiamycin B lyase
MREYTAFRGCLAAAVIVLAACSGGTRQSSPLPAAPSSAPVSGGAPTVDGFPVTINEFALPASQQIGPGKLSVGPDGAIWFPAGHLQMDRVTGPGGITVFTAPAVPPTNPEGTWDGFDSSVSYAGSIYTEFSGLGGIWGVPYSVFLARVTTSGAITPDVQIGPDVLFAGMVTDNSGALWVYTSTSSAIGIVQRLSWNGTQWNRPAECTIEGDGTTLAYGPDGNVYAAAVAIGGPPTIYKISPACNILGIFQPSSAALFSSIAFGRDGALWMVELGTDVIGHLTTSGSYTEYHVPFTGSRPSSITKGSDGAIWFTDAGTNAIGRVTTAGVFSEFSLPTPNAFIQYPSGIVSCPQKCGGAHGRLWFSEPAAHKVGRLEY